MIPSILLAFAGKVGIPEPLRKAAVIGTAIVLLVALLAIGKCTYDRHVIAAHDARQDAATARADKNANDNAASSRVTDVMREQNEATQAQEAIDEAKRIGADPRIAYYNCVRKQQSARSAGKPPPDC